MASSNRLLGREYETAEVSPLGHGFTQNYSPALRYHKNYPGGKLCRTDQEVDAADAEGAVDHPGKLRLIPGHEKIWEDHQAELKAKAEPQPDPGAAGPTPEQILADALKAESDKLEEDRLKALNAPKSLVCDICGKEYPLGKPQALRMHRRSAHKEK